MNFPQKIPTILVSHIMHSCNTCMHISKEIIRKYTKDNFIHYHLCAHAWFSVTTYTCIYICTYILVSPYITKSKSYLAMHFHVQMCVCLHIRKHFSQLSSAYSFIDLPFNINLWRFSALPFFLITPFRPPTTVYTLYSKIVYTYLVGYVSATSMRRQIELQI